MLTTKFLIPCSTDSLQVMLIELFSDYLTTLFELQRLCNISWDWKIIMKVVVHFKVLSRHSSGVTQQNRAIPHSG